MTKPIDHWEFDIAEIDAVLEAEKAERKAAKGTRWKLKLFLVFGFAKVLVGLLLVIPHA